MLRFYWDFVFWFHAGTKHSACQARTVAEAAGVDAGWQLIWGKMSQVQDNFNEAETGRCMKVRIGGIYFNDLMTDISKGTNNLDPSFRCFRGLPLKYHRPGCPRWRGELLRSPAVAAGPVCEPRAGNRAGTDSGAAGITFQSFWELWGHLGL